MKPDLAVILASILLISGCSRSVDTNAPQDPGPAPDAPQPAASVDLTPSQLEAIKIAPVGTYIFPVEKEAVGSISFDEAPSIVQDESTLLGAAATFVLTTKELARARDLYATGGSVAQRELEQAISDQQTAAAALKAARAAVRADGRTEADIDQMIAAGTIDFAESPGSPVKWVLANVLERDIAAVRPGQPVEVRLPDYPDRVFEGRVARVYATVDPNTHCAAVRCEVSDKNGDLRPGMLADVTIYVREPVTATAIPENGVVREGDGTMTAWVTADRRHFTQKKVDLGMLRDGQYQVLSGLQPGELAVTDGAVFLSNMLVAPVDD